jgi:hypothetical protein
MKLFCLKDYSEKALLWLKEGRDLGFAEAVEGVVALFPTSPPPAMPRNVKKAGAKKTRFADFIINSDETEWIIGILNKHIDKDRPKQTALCIMGGIEAGKISRDVTAPSIEREFGVNGNSVKRHLTKYKNPVGRKWYEADLNSFKTIFKR